MMSRIRNSIFTKYFCGLMGLYLLNISVDIADSYPEYIPEDLSFNDQESIVEIVVEQVLGFEDAIKEYDEPDPDDYSKKKNVKLECLVNNTRINTSTRHAFTTNKKLFTYFEDRILHGFKDLDSPPPKV